MLRILIATCLAAAQTAYGQSPPASPKITFMAKPESAKAVEQQARVGELVRLISSSPKGRWELPPDAVGADLETGLDGKAFFTAERPGRYLLINYVGEAPAAWVIVLVGGSQPTPPKPDVPKPDVPVADPIAEAIRKAYEADAGKPYEKKQWAATLAGVWAAGVDHAANERVSTPKQLLDQIRKVIGSELSSEKLAETRKAIGGEIGKLFPSADEPLTAESRKSAATLFAKISKTLEELSK